MCPRIRHAYPSLPPLHPNIAGKALAWRNSSHHLIPRAAHSLEGKRGELIQVHGNQQRGRRPPLAWGCPKYFHSGADTTQMVAALSMHGSSPCRPVALLGALKSAGFSGLCGKEGSCSSGFHEKASKSVSKVESIQFSDLLLNLLEKF